MRFREIELSLESAFLASWFGFPYIPDFKVKKNCNKYVGACVRVCYQHKHIAMLSICAGFKHTRKRRSLPATSVLVQLSQFLAGSGSSLQGCMTYRIQNFITCTHLLPGREVKTLAEVLKVVFTITYKKVIIHKSQSFALSLNTFKSFADVRKGTLKEETKESIILL